MKHRRLLIIALLIASVVSQFAMLTSFAVAALPLVDDFEAGLPAGYDGTIPIGFNPFADPSSTAAISTTDAAPAPTAPGHGSGNHVLKLDLNVVAWAGVTHAFENAGATAWVTQDWSAYEGISLYLYGTGAGTDLFVDVLDNRNPGSIKDDAERWTFAFKDNISGWNEIKIPFANMTRKEIGNGAPNDGFGLTEVHGWGFGTLSTGGAKSYYLDDVSVYGTAPIKPLTVGFSTLNYPITEGGTATVTAKLSKPSAEPVTVHYATTFGPAIPNRDYTPVSGTLTFPANVTQQSFTVHTIDDAKFQGERGVLVELSNPTGGLALGLPPIARVNILDNETVHPPLLDDFETYPYLWSADSTVTLSNPEIPAGDVLALPGQGAYEHVLQVGPKTTFRIFLPLIGRNSPAPSATIQQTLSGSAQGTYNFGRTFPIGQDWSAASGLSFWYYGQNSSTAIQVNLANDRANFSDPAHWQLVWSDEFNSAAGKAPNANVWGNEVGDGTAYGIPGWGNDELEYYTAGGENAAADGQGNLVITTRAADGSLQCYYGPCKYTSARLLTKNRFEVAYGRVEARVKVPVGAGLWPAFWMLGTDIDRVGWPMTGEIDIMEHVGRLPNEIFGTLHGPGYSGGNSYGKVLDLGKLVADDFHTFAVEWQPDKITWFLDGAPFFTAAPTDAFLAGKQWVYNHPFYMLLNVAVGGNFGGAVSPDTTFPQQTLVDYVRLYQAAPEPVSFAASFVDNFSGWQQISLPFTSFQGAAGTTLDLATVRSISFDVSAALLHPVLLDQVRLEGGTPPKTQMDLPVTFDSPTVNYGLLGFGGADDSTIVVDPTDGTNQVAKVVKSGTAELWAGTTLTADGTLGFASKIPFTASATKMTVRVWSPDAGIQVRLKVEDHNNSGISVETEATTTVANTWETLTFDFANQAPGTAALNLANTYDKASIFFNFGVTGATAGAKTYYFDDMAFVSGPPPTPTPTPTPTATPPPSSWDPITFDASTVTYTLTGFGGADDSTVVVDPTDGTNQVARVVKSGTAASWAGTTVSTGANFSVPTLPFTASSTKMTVRVWSPDAGIQVRLKAEDATDPTKSVETEATVTTAAGWQTLTFDFTVPTVPPTAALNLAYTYNKLSIFFNFGVDGATAGAKTYYFDDVAFVSGPPPTPTPTPTPTATPPPSSWDPITFDASTVTYTLTGFGGADDSTVVVDPTDGTNQVARVVKSGTAASWAGTTVSTGPNFSVPTLPFTASSTKMTVRVWSPDAGIQVRLKVEDATDPTKSVETEATVTTAAGWQTLTFDFTVPTVPPTAALNLAYTYNKLSIFFNFGVDGATAGAKTYYFDDVAFVSGPPPTPTPTPTPTATPPPSSWDPITFDASTVTYTLTGFGGADDSTVVVDPTDGTNQVARVVKSGTAASWAGTTVSTGANFSVPTLPFTASSTKMTVRVWSPDAGIQVRLKVEDATDPTKSVETEATATTAAGWQTLTFDFTVPTVPPTAALNLAYTYNKLSIFFNFGVDGATAGAKTYYFDDVAFVSGPPPTPTPTPTPTATPPPSSWDPITFDTSTVTYTLTGFGGADDSTVVVDPTDGTNQVAKVVKSGTAASWAGTTVSTGPNFSVPRLPFTASSTKMTVRVWSPDAGIPVRLKVEDAADPTKSVETEATVTTAAGWQTLTFDFTVPTVPPTAALNLAYTYNKLSIFFNFGVDGATAGAKTYYFDDVAFGP